MDNKEAVRRFILGNFFVPEGSPLADDDPLLEHGVVDSTGVLEIIRFIEEDYGIKLDDDEIVPENLGSIANITAFIERKGGVLKTPAAAVQP
jgi:acyl carrier protein